MHLRIVRGRFDPARYEELMALDAEIVDVQRELAGFSGYQAGVDRAAGTVVAVSTWDTEQHARSPREALAVFAPRLEALGIRVEPSEIYEVVRQA